MTILWLLWFLLFLILSNENLPMKALHMLTMLTAGRKWKTNSRFQCGFLLFFFIFRKSWNADFCFPRLHECHMHPDLQRIGLHATRNIITIFLIKTMSFKWFPHYSFFPFFFVISEAFIALCISLTLCVKMGGFLGDSFNIICSSLVSQACLLGRTDCVPGQPDGGEIIQH